MNKILPAFFLVIITYSAYSQNESLDHSSDKSGKMYFYWGWNSSAYTKSDIKFTGTDYDFTLSNVIAKDRQSKFKLDTYFNPVKFTIPQTNFRIGYYLNDRWDISMGFDHMKYVVQANQSVEINGYINNISGTYDGVYSNEDIIISTGFLRFEHTDGLNYVNAEIRHTDKIFEYRNWEASLKEGVGFGILRPRTNTKLLNKPRYDEFHVAGYGLGAIIGLNISFQDKFFVQNEYKWGYINMPDIRTTMSSSDKASQSFYFSQINIVFGGMIRINRSSRERSRNEK